MFGPALTGNKHTAETLTIQQANTPFRTLNYPATTHTIRCSQCAFSSKSECDQKEPRQYIHLYIREYALLHTYLFAYIERCKPGGKCTPYVHMRMRGPCFGYFTGRSLLFTTNINASDRHGRIFSRTT